MKKVFFLVSFILFLVSIKAQDLPLPTQAQIEWQNAELVAVYHYDLHVFDGKKYWQGENRVTPIPDANIFNPTEYNMDQWIQSAVDMGAKIAVITATQETGFAIYQSDVNPYCMKILDWKDGKGDIVKDFVESCRKYGIKPGIYIGTRWNSFLGVFDHKMANIESSKLQENRQKYYTKMCEGMTEELMSKYGDLSMVWYDGGALSTALGGPNVIPIVEKYQKNIIFYHSPERADLRWAGSESGTAPYPCWGTFAKDSNPNGDPNAKYYIPAMSDSPLRGYDGVHSWFWEPNEDKNIYPLESLVDMYEKSVGRNSTLILGLTPDDRGLLPDADVARLKEFGNEIKRIYSSPKGSTKGENNELTIKLTDGNEISRIVIQENISNGERVRKYKVEGKVGDSWSVLNEGSCIGHKRIIRLDVPVNVSEVKLTIGQSVGTPDIINFSVY